MSHRAQFGVSLLLALLLVWLTPTPARRSVNVAPVCAPRPVAQGAVDPARSAYERGAVADEDRWDDDTNPRPLRAVERRLSNGLEVWIVEDPTEPVVAVRVAIGAGAVDDPLAHLVEHLIFQGTDRLGALDWASERPFLDDQRFLTALLAGSDDPELRATLAEVHAAASEYASPNELMRLLDHLGATGVNATTSPEVTSFQATIPPRALGQWAGTMAEALAGPVFRGFVAEQAVVEHEADLRDGCGLRRAHHELFAAMYGDHPYGHPVGGTRETRAAIDVDAAAALHERLYRPDNALVVLVGDVIADEAVAVLEEAFGGGHSRPGEAHPVDRRRGSLRGERPPGGSPMAYPQVRIADPVDPRCAIPASEWAPGGSRAADRRAGSSHRVDRCRGSSAGNDGPVDPGWRFPRGILPSGASRTARGRSAGRKKGATVAVAPAPGVRLAPAAPGRPRAGAPGIAGAPRADGRARGTR